MSTRCGFKLLEVLVALAIVVAAWAGIAAALPVEGGTGNAGAFAANDEAAIVFLPDGSSSGGRMTRPG
jgi:type II secretory pathway component PulJ